MRDGTRRITHITELAGMEGDVIITQDLFRFQFNAQSYGDEVKGSYESTHMRPVFSPRAAYYGMENDLLEVMKQ